MVDILVKVSAVPVSDQPGCTPRRASRLVLENLAATEALGMGQEKLRRRDHLIRIKPWRVRILPSAFCAWLDAREAMVRRHIALDAEAFVRLVEMRDRRSEPGIHTAISPADR